LELLGQANNPVEFINSAVLFVNREFRVADDVEEEDMRDLELDLLFNLGQHPVTLRHNKAIHNPVSPRAVETKLAQQKSPPLQSVL
jgi:hypothetical protein